VNTAAGRSRQAAVLHPASIRLEGATAIVSIWFEETGGKNKRFGTRSSTTGARAWSPLKLEPTGCCGVKLPAASEKVLLCRLGNPEPARVRKRSALSLPHYLESPVPVID